MKQGVMSFIFLWIAIFSIGFAGAVLADQPIPGQTALPKLQVATDKLTIPAQCAPGFTPIKIKLIKHEGKRWYQYDCVQQKVIKRSCNADTEVINVKNQFVTLPSDGKSNDSKLFLSYGCFNYIPVK